MFETNAVSNQFIAFLDCSNTSFMDIYNQSNY